MDRHSTRKLYRRFPRREIGIDLFHQSCLVALCFLRARARATTRQDGREKGDARETREASEA